MNVQIYGKSKCFDTKKAERWFKERGIRFQRIDLPRFGMSRGEILSVLSAVGGAARLIDSKHPDAALLSYLAHPRDVEQRLQDDPSIFLTPIVRNGKQATVGYKPEIWGKWE